MKKNTEKTSTSKKTKKAKAAVSKTSKSGKNKIVELQKDKDDINNEAVFSEKITNESNGFKKSFIENIKTVLLAILLALFIRSFFLEPFRIPSGSMYPTLRVGDFLFVTKYTYGYSRYSFPGSLPLFDGRVWYTAPQRGDVVVFRCPQKTNTDFIKRIIGLPGDKVQVKGGRLYINNKMVDRSDDGRYIVDEYVATPEFYHKYIEILPEGVQHQIIEISDEERIVDNTEEFLVPEDSFFVMGDNRDRSDDSRIRVGFVDKQYLIGKARFIFFSHNDKGSILKPWTWPRAIRWERFFKGIN